MRYYLSDTNSSATTYVNDVKHAGDVRNKYINTIRASLHKLQELSDVRSAGGHIMHNGWEIISKNRQNRSRLF